MKILLIALISLLIFSASVSATSLGELKVKKREGKAKISMKKLKAKSSKLKVKAKKNLHKVKKLAKKGKASKAKIKSVVVKVEEQVEVQAEVVPPTLEEAPVAAIQGAPVPTMAPLIQGTPKVEPSKHKSGFQFGGGFLAGAAAVSGGYLRSLNDRVSLLFDVGGGIGDRYQVGAVALGGIYNLLECFVLGLTVNYTYFNLDSAGQIGSLIGVGKPAKGGYGGVGILALKNFGKFAVQAGFDTTSGPRAQVNYTF